MSSYSWIKLYHEIIDDPKMGRMSDSLWRRTIELFLMAGRNGNEGLLPSLHDISWALRISDDQLKSDLIELQKVGIVEADKNGCWHVVNFSKRQSPADVKDRVAQYRDRAKKHGYYEDATKEKPVSNETLPERYTDTDTEEDTDKNIGEKKTHHTDKTTCPKEWMDVLYQITQTDPAVATVAQRSNLSSCGKALISSGATLDQLQIFSRNWLALDWRGKKGQPPTAKQIRDEWGKYSKSQNGNGQHDVEYVQDYKIGYTAAGKEIHLPLDFRP